MSGWNHAPAALHPGKEPPGTHWIGGWAGHITGLNDVEKRKFLTLPGLELRPLCRPAQLWLLMQIDYMKSPSWSAEVNNSVMYEALSQKRKTLRRIFGPKINEVMGIGTEWHTEETQKLQNVQCNQLIIPNLQYCWVIKKLMVIYSFVV
jgi:hypothetical protein